MAGRMPPSTAIHDNPPTDRASSNETAANYARLQQWIERECSECDAAINEHRKQVADYRTQKGRLLELQKKISHPIMVPFGSVGFMPGQLVRTNEVLVLLGANYFAECSVHDTTKIIDRRIREINVLIDKLEHQKRNASERLNFAQGLFGGATDGKDGLIEIREEYDEKKEAEARRKRAERAAAARAEKKVPEAAFEDMMSRLDELEKEEMTDERATKSARVRQEEVDSDDEIEEDDKYEQQRVLAPPRGVSEEEYKRLLARLDQDTSEEEMDSEDSDVIEEVDEELDSDDLSDSDQQKRVKLEQLRKQKVAEERMSLVDRELKERAAVQSQPQLRRPLIEVIEDEPAPTVTPASVQSISKQAPTMTVVSENDRVVDLVEYQNQQEEDDKAKENAPSSKGKLTHKRSVRFKKNLEAGPCEKSIDSVDDVLPSLEAQPNPRSILRNKSEESPIDKIAFSEMEDQRTTTILPSGDAFSGCVVERSSELPIVFKPVDEPPRRVSRFKLQRMQQATE